MDLLFTYEEVKILCLQSYCEGYNEGLGDGNPMSRAHDPKKLFENSYFEEHVNDLIEV
jgi:hypothetical protein